MLLPLLLVLLAGAAAAFFYMRSAANGGKRKATDPSVIAAPTVPAKAKGKKVDITAKSASSSSSSSSARKGSDAAPAADHPLLLRHLRGHQGAITSVAVSPDARHVASVARDEQLRLWTVVPDQKTAHFARHNLKKAEHGSAVALGPGIVVVALEPRRAIAVLAIKDDVEKNQAFLTPAFEFATPHKQPITSLVLSAQGNVLATMAEGSEDLNVHVFSLSLSANGGSAKLVQSIPLAQLCNYSLALSLDGRFLAAGTKLSDTKIMELVYSGQHKGKGASSSASASSASSGAPTLERVEPATTLRGLQRGVRCLAFGLPESGLLVCASADGASFTEHSLSAFSVARGGMREQPRLLARTETGLSLATAAAAAAGGPVEMHLDVHEEAPEVAPIIALALGSTLQLWAGSSAASSTSSNAAAAAAASSSSSSSSATGRLLVSIPPNQAHKGAVTALAFNKPSLVSSSSAAGVPSLPPPRVLVTAGDNKTISMWKLPKLNA
jgi:WD40 repeat protein